MVEVAADAAVDGVEGHVVVAGAARVVVVVGRRQGGGRGGAAEEAAEGLALAHVAVVSGGGGGGAFDVDAVGEELGAAEAALVARGCQGRRWVIGGGGGGVRGSEGGSGGRGRGGGAGVLEQEYRGRWEACPRSQQSTPNQSLNRCLQEIKKYG